MKKLSQILDVFTSSPSAIFCTSLLFSLIQGCATSGAHNIMIYRNKPDIENTQLAVISGGVSSIPYKKLKFEIDGKEIPQGYFATVLPGQHEISLSGYWWNPGNNVARDVLFAPCVVGFLIPPLIFTCPRADKSCNSSGLINIISGTEYLVSVDWSQSPPKAIVNEVGSNSEILKMDCVRRDSKFE
ncbi:MAG: hypothetical protein WBL28_11690 [Methylotenera sp.]